MAFFHQAFPCFSRFHLWKTPKSSLRCRKCGKVEGTGEGIWLRVWQSKGSAYICSPCPKAGLCTEDYSVLIRNTTERVSLFSQGPLRGLQGCPLARQITGQTTVWLRKEKDLVTTGKESILRTPMQGTIQSLSFLLLWQLFSCKEYVRVQFHKRNAQLIFISARNKTDNQVLAQTLEKPSQCLWSFSFSFYL